jgi:phage repressor protein C with HTH and peptisase S24 domain
MARRKTLPESVRAKLALAERLTALRSELFGDRGGPEMARRLGIPVRTWYNYEGGVTVPAEVVLKIIELTAVEASWLLHGEGPKFRHVRTDRRDPGKSPAVTIGALLRTALQLLENEDAQSAERALTSDDHGGGLLDDDTVTHAELMNAARAAEGALARSLDPGTHSSELRREWLAAQRDNRCLQISGDSMAPVVADGASVAYATGEEEIQQLDGKLVVAWLENQPVVRWFQNCGRFALLRAENPNSVPQQVLVDMDDTKHRPRFRRVLCINTPH